MLAISSPARFFDPLGFFMRHGFYEVRNEGPQAEALGVFSSMCTRFSTRLKHKPSKYGALRP